MPPQTYAGVKQIHASGGSGSDTLTVDGAFTIPIFYDGGGNAGDKLVLQNASWNTITHSFTNDHDGTVALDPDGPGGAAPTLITYTGLAPISDNMSAANRVFSFPGASETITLSDDPAAVAGVSRIDSTLGESVDFTNPTSTLTVNASAGTGPDIIDLQGLDPAFNANATINAGSDGNHITVEATTGTTNFWSVNGGSGNDTITIDFGSLAAPVNVQGGGGQDSLLINGTSGDDTIAISASAVTRGIEAVTYASIGDLTVDAKDGADVVTVNGTGPATTVLGGAGDDRFFVNATGPAGVTLNGQADSDDYTVNFGALNGVVIVADTPFANIFDRLFVTGTSGPDVLRIGPAVVTRNGIETVNYSGIEELNVDAGDGNDDITVDGTSVPTKVLGGSGDDSFAVNGVMVAPLTLDGGAGNDSLLFNGTSGDDVIILTDNSISGLGSGVTYTSIENLVIDAGAGNDLVDGSALTISVTIYGGTGNDILIGGSNDDKLYGQDGDDDLIGNLGNDYLDGGDGSDGLVGDKGTIVREVVTGPASLLSTPDGKVEASINNPGIIRRNITLIDENLGGNDILVGGNGNDYLHGGAGNDKLYGNDGADALYGDAGNDEIFGGAGNDHLYGGAGNDVLDGQAGADIAYGGDGDDRLVADQSGDIIIDWFGNFNDFIVPGPGYGSPTIVRSPSPWVQDFLLKLAGADGATNPNAEIRIVIPGSTLQQSNSGPGGHS
jgi:Ca2+-binding RTX toxin-like protein